MYKHIKQYSVVQVSNLLIRPGGSSWVILWAVAAAHSGLWMQWMYFIMVLATVKVSLL